MKTDKYKKKFVKESSKDTHVFNPIKKINIKFDKGALEMFIGYVFSNDPSISKMNLTNMNKLFELVNLHSYELDAEMYSRITILKAALDGKLRQGIEKPELLKTYCRKENDPDCDAVLSRVEEFMRLSKNEINYISKKVIKTLQFSFIVFFKDLIVNEFMRIDQGDFSDLEEITKAVGDKCKALMNEIRRVNQVTTLDTFSLEPEVFEAFVEDTVKHAADPNMAIMTGVRMLNEVLSPGIMCARFYLVLA